MSAKILFLMILWSAGLLSLSACSSSGGSAIDSLFGHFSSSPILTPISDQIVSQGNLLKIDVNNIQNGSPGNDTGMSYACYYDTTIDHTVDNTQQCKDIPDTLSQVTFNSSTGVLQWTPDTSTLGNFELKIVGTNSDGQYEEIFQVGVRLQFNGLTNFSTITGTSVIANWTPNPSAIAYQIFKLNTMTGLYELYQTTSGGSTSSVAITGLAPNTGYTFRVEAIDALGNTDGNVVSKSVTTTTLTKLALTPTNQTVTSGIPVSISVQAYDTTGAPETVGGITLTPAIQSGTSTGTFSAVTDNNNGTYSFTFTPAVVGSAIDIGVSANTSFYLMNTTHLTVIPGVASPSQSTFLASSSTVSSGSTVTLTATLKDLNGNPIDPSSTVAITPSGGTSTGTMSAVINQGGGVYTTTYTGVVAGTAQTFAVKVNGTTVAITPAVTVQVLPGPVFASNSTFTTTSATVASGSSVTLTATLKDANNNMIDPSSVVAFNKSGGTSTGTLSSLTNSSQGIYTATYSGIVAGTAQTITVSVNGVTLPLSVTEQVVPGAPSLTNSSLSLSSGTVVSGNFVTATATLMDANNNPIDSGITVTFSKTGGTSTGTFGSVSNQGSGVYNIRYTGVVAGTAQTIRVLSNGVDVGLTATVQVVPGAPSLSNSTFTTSSATLISGSTATLTATMKDVNNNPVSSGVAVTMSALGGTSTGNLSAVTNAGSGVYTATYQGVASGTAQSISIFVDGTSLGLSVSETVNPGPMVLANSTFTISAATISSGSGATLTATLRDLNNNPISSSSTITMPVSGGTSTGTMSTIVNQGNGVYTATYTGVVSGTAQTIKALSNGVDVGLSVTVQVVPGAPSLSNSTFTTSSATLISGNTATLTATMKDSNNNLISSGITVTMNALGGTSTGTLSSVTNAGSGVYTATYQGLASGSAQTISVLIGGSSFGLSVTETVKPGPVNLTNSSFTISSASITSGSAATLTATLLDLNNNPIDSSSTVTMSASGGTSTGTIGTITNQGNGVYTATYTGVTAGTAQTIGVLVNSVATTMTVSVSVVPGSPSGSTSTISAASTVLSGSLDTVTATIRDANNNPISSGITVTFSKTGGTSTGNFSSVTNQGSGVYQINYQGVTAGTAQTIAVLVGGSSLGPSTTIAVLPGAPSNALSTLTVSASTVTAGSSVTLTATIVDANSNPISSGILVGFDKFSGTSFGNLSSVTNQGSGVYTATYTGITAGTAQTVSATVGGADFGPTQTVQVLVGAPSSTTSTLTIASSPLASGNTANITAVVKDAYNNPITTEYTISFDTVGGTSTGNLGSVTNAGAGTFTTTYQGLLAGSAQTLRVLANSNPISGLSGSIQVVPGAVNSSNSVFTIGSSVVQSGTSTGLSINLRDTNNNTISSGATITFTKSTGVSDGTISSVTNSGSGNYSATYTAVTQGTAQTITLLVNGVSTGMSVSVTVTAGPPTQMTISGPTNPVNSIDCNGPYTVTLKDASNNVTSSLSSFTMALSSTPANAFSGTIFTDPTCSSSTTTLSFPALTSTLPFYYKSYVPQNITLTLTPSNSIAVNNITLQNSAVLSWIGTAASFTMSGSGNTNVGDDQGGGTWQSYDAVASGNYLYQVDYSSGRILKYDLVGNSFVGWLGYIGSTVGLSSGCSSNAVGDLTPTWCTGGRANSALANPGTNTTAVLINTRAIAADGTYLYVWANGRILRFTQSSGAYNGWIGGVGANAPPTSGQLATCSGQTANTKTPGWCLGGQTTTGNADGFFGNNSTGYLTVISGMIYATDNGNHRVMSFNASTGAFAGWVGLINAVPSSPAACSSQLTNQYTATWCFGGTAQNNSAVNYSGNAGTEAVAKASGAGFSGPWGIDGDSTYLYIADRSNDRIARVLISSGAFSGWIGKIQYSDANNPTTPSQTAGSYTNTWTTGGITTSSSGTNGFGNTSNIHVYGSSLYISDSYNRVIQLNTADGQAFTWIGRAGTSPTGGVTGCSSTPVGGATPGWCTGGAGNYSGNSNSAFNNPMGIAFSSPNMYVVDRDNFRTQVFTQSTGAFVGWIGASQIQQTSWSRTSPTQFARMGYDDFSFGDVTGAWSSIAQSGTNFYLPDYGWNRIKQYSTTTGTDGGFIGQIGAYPPTGPSQCVGFTSGMTPFWCTGGGRGGSGGGIQAYNNPGSVAADATYLYVADYSNGRVDKVRISDTLYIGWIGDVSTTPTDGVTGCLTTSAGTATPGWCIGGAAQNGNAQGMFNGPRGIYYDSAISKLFVVDNSSRLMQVDPSSGNMDQATGSINAGTGCSLTSNTASGWCTNPTGNGASNAYGGINRGTGIATDTTYVYVTDTANNRIYRYNKSTGAPAGFIGQLQNSTNLDITAGTGGACASLSAGYPQPAPGWCHGTALGVALTAPTTPTAPKDGAFNNPTAIWSDGTYLYISDSNWNRVVRITSSTGAYAGWKGYISSASGISPSTCATAGAGSVTPTWCYGGQAGPSMTLGGFDFPTGITGDSNYLYVHDGRNNRLVTVPKN